MNVIYHTLNDDDVRDIYERDDAQKMMRCDDASSCDYHALHQGGSYGATHCTLFRAYACVCLRQALLAVARIQKQNKEASQQIFPMHVYIQN